MQLARALLEVEQLRDADAIDALDGLASVRGREARARSAAAELSS